MSNFTLKSTKIKMPEFPTNSQRNPFNKLKLCQTLTISPAETPSHEVEEAKLSGKRKQARPFSSYVR